MLVTLLLQMELMCCNFGAKEKFLFRFFFFLTIDKINQSKQLNSAEVASFQLALSAAIAPAEGGQVQGRLCIFSLSLRVTPSHWRAVHRCERFSDSWGHRRLHSSSSQLPPLHTSFD